MKTFFKLFFLFLSITAFSQEKLNNGNTTSKNITGRVTDVSGMPLSGVNILVKRTEKGTQTDVNGHYSIDAKKGNVLVYSFIGMHTQEKTVENDTSAIDIILNENTEALKEVVINAEKISKKEKARSYSSTTITSDKLLKGGYINVVQALIGTVAGLSYQGSSDKAGQFYIRGQSALNHVEPLFIYDGVPTEKGDILNINIFDIEKIEVIKSASGTLKYGPRAVGGVIIVTSKFYNNFLEGKNSYTGESFKVKKYQGNLKVEENLLNNQYIEELSIANSVEETYAIYFKQKDQYVHIPAYYFDVYNYFKKWNNRDYELRVLFNGAARDFDNPEQLKALAYELEAAKEYKLASNIYTQVLRLLPEDMQSYRDLALAYKEMGFLEESAAILNNLTVGESTLDNRLTQFSGIDYILKNDTVQLDKGEVGAIYDVRIIADWNRYDANINLHVIDPNREICYYENLTTEQGGQLAQNMSQGYGPEEFTLKNAKKGSYFVMVNYTPNSEVEKEIPTFLKLTMFKNYGQSNEIKEIKVIQLTEPKNNYIIAEFEI